MEFGDNESWVCQGETNEVEMGLTNTTADRQ
jgi:hypothetical protein